MSPFIKVQKQAKLIYSFISEYNGYPCWDGEEGMRGELLQDVT